MTPTVIWAHWQVGLLCNGLVWSSGDSGGRHWLQTCRGAHFVRNTNTQTHTITFQIHKNTKPNTVAGRAGLVANLPGGAGPQQQHFQEVPTFQKQEELNWPAEWGLFLCCIFWWVLNIFQQMLHSIHRLSRQPSTALTGLPNMFQAPTSPNTAGLTWIRWEWWWWCWSCHRAIGLEFKQVFQRDLMSFLAKQPSDFEAAKRIYTEVDLEKNLQSQNCNSGRQLWQDNRD